MKRIMTFAIFMAVCAISAKAQLEVDSLGNVFVGTNITDGRLNVGKAGLKCSSDSLPAISVSTTSGGKDITTTGIHALCTNIRKKGIGIESTMLGGVSDSEGTYGILGRAGLTPSCVGVYGGIMGFTNVNNFAGIYGTSGASTSIYFGNYTGHYAGFFRGNVRVISGSIYATVLSPSATTGNGNTQGVNVISADRADGETVTNKLSQVQTIQFMRDKREMGDEEETIEMFASNFAIDHPK